MSAGYMYVLEHYSEIKHINGGGGGHFGEKERGKMCSQTLSDVQAHEVAQYADYDKKPTR